MKRALISIASIVLGVVFIAWMFAPRSFRR